MRHSDRPLGTALSQRNYGRRDVIKLAGTFGALGSLGLLGACSNEDSKPQSGGKTGGKAKTVTLTYWTWMNSEDVKNPRAAAQGKIIKAFMAANPDVRIVEQVVPWQELGQQLLQAVAAGKAPDVSRQRDGMLQDLVASKSLEELDEFVKDWSGERKKDYFYNWDDTVVGGHKYAFRQSIRAANRLYYRTDLYQAAGFSSPPVTAEEFLAVSKATTKGDTSGFLQAFSKADGLSNFMQQCPSMYWSLGSDLVDESGKPTFHEDAGQEIFTFYQDAAWKHGVMPSRVATMNSDGTADVFVGGGSASHLTHSAEWGDWSTRETLKGRLSTANTFSFGSDGKPAPINTAGAWLLVMPRGAQKEAAWRFMEFMQSKEAELIDSQTAKELPTRRSTAKDPWFKSDDASYIATLLADMQKYEHPATTLRIKKYSQLSLILADAAQEIIANKADVAATLASAASTYKAAL